MSDSKKCKADLTLLFLHPNEYEAYKDWLPDIFDIRIVRPVGKRPWTVQEYEARKRIK